MQDDNQRERLNLLKERENGRHEIRCERACAEQTNPDEGEADGGARQAQHEDLRVMSSGGNACAASRVSSQSAD